MKKLLLVGLGLTLALPNATIFGSDTEVDSKEAVAVTAETVKLEAGFSLKGDRAENSIFFWEVAKSFNTAANNGSFFNANVSETKKQLALMEAILGEDADVEVNKVTTATKVITHTIDGVNGYNNVVYVNTALRRAFGVSRAVVLGMSMTAKQTLLKGYIARINTVLEANDGKLLGRQMANFAITTKGVLASTDNVDTVNTFVADNSVEAEAGFVSKTGSATVAVATSRWTWGSVAALGAGYAFLAYTGGRK